MPEPAAAEAIEPTTSETQKPLNPGLAKLFDEKFLQPDKPPPEAGDGDGDGEPEVMQIGEPREPAAAREAPTDKTKRPEPDPAPPEPAPEPEPAPASTKRKPTVEGLMPDFGAAPEPTAALPDSEVARNMPEEPPAFLKTKQQQDNYRNWRTHQIKLERELHDLRQRNSASPSEEVATMNSELQKQNEELLSRIERVDLYNSPRFQAEFVAPRDKVFVEAMNLVKEVGVDPENLRSAMALTGRAKQDALDEIGDSIQSKMQREKFGRLVDVIDEKTAAISERLQRSHETTAEQRKQELIERHRNGERSMTELKTILAAKNKEFEDTEFEFVKRSDRPEYSWWNEELDNANQAAEHLLLRASPEEAAIGAILAGHSLRIYKALKAERAARLAAEADAASLRDSNADTSEDRGPRKKSATKAGTSFTEGVFQHLRGAS